MYYDRDGDPIGVRDWNQLLSSTTYKRVARTTVTSAADPSATYDVSTVWLGMNHNWSGHGLLIIFETMVFDSSGESLDCCRYETEQQARAGHEDMVTVVAATVVDDPVIMDAADAEWERMVPRAFGVSKWSDPREDSLPSDKERDV